MRRAGPRGDRAPPEALAVRFEGQGDRDAPPRADSRSGEALRRLPAPDERRDASARDDRDGAELRAPAPPRGRADERARRFGAGADHRAPPRAPGAHADGGAPHHARPRRRRPDGEPRRRDVRGSDRRGGAGRCALREARASVHGRPPRLDREARARRGEGSRRFRETCPIRSGCRRAAGSATGVRSGSRNASRRSRRSSTFRRGAARAAGCAEGEDGDLLRRRGYGSTTARRRGSSSGAAPS